MAGSKKEQIQAADRICRKLNISLHQLMNKMDEYNKRVFELNRSTVDYMKNFIAPKGVIINDVIEYNLNEDDKTILLGYKQKAVETLKEEFPELFEVIEDLKVFEGKIDINQFL